MAKADDDIVKIAYHSKRMVLKVTRHMTRNVSLTLVFRLLVTFVLTTVVIETIHIATSGNSGRILSNVKLRKVENRNISVKSRNVLQLSSDSRITNRTVFTSNDKTSNLSSSSLQTNISKSSYATLNSTNSTSALANKQNNNHLPQEKNSKNVTSADVTTESLKVRERLKAERAQVYYRVMVTYYSDLEKLCAKKKAQMPPPTKSYCPCISPFLVGEKPVPQENLPTIGELELQFTQLEDGGHFQPPNCQAIHHVTIIVPFRDREEHLNIFLNHIHPFLQRQLIEYRIFVIEEVPNKIFNKATMMNIGFVEALKIFPNTDCVVFHDVDMLPEDDRNLYACTDKPRHMGAFVDKWKYNLPYTYLFGGAISLTPKQFQLVNGYSNEFYGWGGEDDDMFQRVRARNLEITRYPKEVSKYMMLKHHRDRLNPTNAKRGVSVKWRPQHYAVNGLNSLKYTLKAIEHRPLYTWILADIEIPKL